MKPLYGGSRAARTIIIVDWRSLGITGSPLTLLAAPPSPRACLQGYSNRLVDLALHMQKVDSA